MTDDSVQDRIADAMPPTPAVDEQAATDEFTMSHDEQRELSDALETWIRDLYDRGFSPSELGVVLNGFGHRMNASRCRPHEYDRIALSIELRDTIETWREEQDGEVPVLAVAEAVEEMGRHYRHEARKEVYQDDDE